MNQMRHPLLAVFFSLLLLWGQSNMVSAAEESAEQQQGLNQTESIPELETGRSPWAITLFDSEPVENQELLWEQTKLVFGLGFGVLGVVYLLPESVSNWDRSEIDVTGDWWDNVSAGPVVDEDDLAINWVGHTYFGGVYYVSARSSGYNEWNSFVYSALMSTFYWEYGIEALAEVPSIQDLIITPVGGWLYGEWAFREKQAIQANDNKVFGSELLGSTALFLLDPTGQINGWVNGGKENPPVNQLSLNLDTAPSFYDVESPSDRNYLGLTLRFRW